MADAKLEGEAETVDPWAGDLRLVEFFGSAWAQIDRFARLLRDHGVARGLLGPREPARLWERHLLNCAAVTPLVAGAQHVIDLGSGAGLPGVVLAVLLPASRVTLLEAMQRRADWLTEVTRDLRLENVTVVRARAEDVVGELHAEVVTARAVGPLDRLVRWAVPLLDQDGRLVALKGHRAQAEVDASRGVCRKAGLTSIEVLTTGTLPSAEKTTVIVARRGKNGD